MKVFFQPIVRLEDRTIAGFEALLRWVTLSGETVAPDELVMECRERVQRDQSHQRPRTQAMRDERWQNLAWTRRGGWPTGFGAGALPTGM